MRGAESGFRLGNGSGLHERRERLVHRHHPEPAPEDDLVVEMVELAPPDVGADRVGREEDLHGHGAPRAIPPGDELLADDGRKAKGELLPDLRLLGRGEEVEDAVDGLGRVVRVGGRQHEMPRLRGCQDGAGRRLVAHLADKEDIRVLAEGGDERPGEVGGVRADLDLLHDRLPVPVFVLDGVLDRDDVLLLLANHPVEKGGEGGRLPGAGGPRDEDEAARDAGQIVERGGKTQLGEGGDPPRQNTEGGRLAPLRPVDVDPKAADGGHAEGEVDGARLRETAPPLRREGRADEAADRLRTERLAGERLDAAVKADRRGRSRDEQKIGPAAPDRLGQERDEAPRERARFWRGALTAGFHAGLVPPDELEAARAGLLAAGVEGADEPVQLFGVHGESLRTRRPVRRPASPTMPGVPSFPPVPEQLDLLLKGTEACVQREELEKKLARSRTTGKPLKVKVGFDPSAPDLHLGHTVVFRKMRHFQELGHEVVFLIGDFTGMIGDPTGKKATRPQLSREEILRNAETYRAQVSRILDPAATIVDFNSRWLSALGAEGMIRLAAKYTVARLLERDDFATRFAAQKPIAVHELLYPLCQAYDSVALETDVELGGTDQLFNLLVGRDLMREWGLEPQVVMTLPLLVGTDGAEKMSKSLGNQIGITEPPDEIYGKVMSISDETMWGYWTLLTDLRPAEIAELKAGVAEGRVHPKRAKMDLARRIVTDFHGAAAAARAEAQFETRFAGGAGAVEAVSVVIHAPTATATAEVIAPNVSGTNEAIAPMALVDVLVEAGLASSKNMARRKIREGAVAVSDDGRSWSKVENPAAFFEYGPEGTRFLRLGRQFRLVRSPSSKNPEEVA